MNEKKNKAISDYNAALKLIDEGKLSKAQKLLEKAVKSVPVFFQAHNSLGNVFEQIGLTNKALQCYEAANKHHPNNHIILNNIGGALSKLGYYEKAENAFHQSLKIEPSYSLALINLIVVLAKTKKIDTALTLVHNQNEKSSLFVGGLSLLLSLWPNDTLEDLRAKSEDQLLCSITQIAENKIKLNEVKQFLVISSDALCPLRYLISLLSLNEDPALLDIADVFLASLLLNEGCKKYYFYFKAQQFLRSGMPNDAISSMREAIKYGIDAEDLSNLIDALYWTGKYDDALNILLDNEGRIKPSVNSAALFFHKHLFKQAWQQYLTSDVHFKIHPRTQDLDNSAISQTLLLNANQGVGDIVMFLSCLNLFINNNKAVDITINCDCRLHPIIQRSFKQVNTIFNKSILSRFDNSSNNDVLSNYSKVIWLPEICPSFRNHINDFFDTKPYLTPDINLSNKYKSLFSKTLNGLNVGFAWKGGTAQNNLNNKSAQLSDFLQLFKIPNVNWINLQYGNVQNQLNKLMAAHDVKILNLSGIAPNNDLEDQLALINNLDLVIQTSNTSAHLAGSIGTPTWLLLNEIVDFRWFSNGINDQSAWYPSVRMIKKGQKQSWEELVELIVPELTALAATKS